MTILRVLLLGLAALLVAGAFYQALATYREERAYPPPGQRVYVGGHGYHIYCTGQGQPTVILEAALSGTSLDWSWVQPEVARFTRVCSYDRAGYGWSEPRSEPRTSSQIAAELHALLHATAIEGPYVLVAHSMGGYHARVFADQFPDEVAGMVLIDVSHEAMFSYWPPEYARRDQQQIDLARFGAPLGLVRLAHALGALPELEAFVRQFPATAQGPLRSFLLRRSHYVTWNSELAVREQSAAEVHATRPFGDRPLIVLTAGAHTVPGQSDSTATERRWQAHQRELLALSTNSRQVVVETSDHYIQLDNPAIVVESIRQVIEAARRRSALP